MRDGIIPDRAQSTRAMNHSPITPPQATGSRRVAHVFMDTVEMGSGPPAPEENGVAALTGSRVSRFAGGPLGEWRTTSAGHRRDAFH